MRGRIMTALTRSAKCGAHMMQATRRREILTKLLIRLSPCLPTLLYNYSRVGEDFFVNCAVAKIHIMYGVSGWGESF